MVERKITVPSKIEFIDDVFSFVDNELNGVECPQKIRTQVKIVVDEIFTNITSYAYYPDEGDVTVRIEIAGEPMLAVIEFADKGKPYNPLEKDDPDVTLSADERKVGGLGIFLVKKFMDSSEYRYSDGQNILTVKKSLFGKLENK